MISNRMSDLSSVSASASTVFTDINSLKSIQSKPGDNSPEAMRAVAKQFESLFINMVMKSMRQANEVFSEGNYDDGFETKFYQDMLDNQLSINMTEGSGIGLADIIYRQLSQYQSMNSQTPSLEQIKANGIRGLEAYQQQLATASSTDTFMADDFSSPAAFIEKFYPMAKEIGEALNVDAKALLAQAALETGWGQHLSTDSRKNSHNLFNIKADSRWQGETVEVETLEYRHEAQHENKQGQSQKEMATFRAYDSFDDSFRDYSEFISTSPRYQKALTHGQDPERYAQELQSAGYATDPQYAEKISKIINSDVMQLAVLK